MRILSIFGPPLICLLAGCASAPPAPTAQRLEQHGLTVSAYALATKSEVKQVFKVNLLDRGVLPVKVMAENRSRSASFLIAKDNIAIMSETTRMPNSSGQIARQMGTWTRAQQLTLAGSTGVPLIFLTAAFTPTDGAFVFKPQEENLTGKEFLTRTLGPGQSAEGYVYFRFAKPAETTNAYHLVSDVKDLSTSEMIPFDLPLNLNLN